VWARRKTVVVTSVTAYAVLLVVGPHLLGAWTGAVVLVASYVVGFAWLVLVVAPWAARGRPRGTPVRHRRP
jgi:hypothetical protein